VFKGVSCMRNTPDGETKPSNWYEHVDAESACWQMALDEFYKKISN
jgi:hypothetical protein